MATTHRNRLVTAISNAPGTTGALTIAAAPSGYRSFGAADNGLSFDVSIVDGPAWEIRTGCVYTHAGTSLARGTLEDSSTGSAIALTSAAVVTVTLTAGEGNLLGSSALRRTPASPTTADVTGVPGVLHALDISGLTATRSLILPAGTDGQRIGVYLSTGGSGYDLDIRGGTGVTINGGAAATKFTCLVQAREYMVFRATGASNWQVDVDGRSDLAWRVQSDDATVQNILSSTLTTVSAALPNVLFGVAHWYASGVFSPKRPGRWLVGASLALQTITATLIAAAETNMAGAIYKSDGNTDSIALGTVPLMKSASSGKSLGGFSPSGVLSLDGVSEYVSVKIYQNSGQTLALTATSRACNFWGVWLGD